MDMVCSRLCINIDIPQFRSCDAGCPKRMPSPASSTEVDEIDKAIQRTRCLFALCIACFFFFFVAFVSLV